MTIPRRPWMSLGLALAIGLILGRASAPFGGHRLAADRSDRANRDQIASGPISIEHNPGLKIQVDHDAIYYLDYKGGRLLATVPSTRTSVGGTRMIEGFAERDLVADFHLTAGSADPEFLMTTGTLGALNDAWAPLYVFEAGSKQVATYRLTPQTVGMSAKPRFDLLEIRPLPPVALTAGTPRG